MEDQLSLMKEYTDDLKRVSPELVYNVVVILQKIIEQKSQEKIIVMEQNLRLFHLV